MKRIITFLAVLLLFFAGISNASAAALAERGGSPVWRVTLEGRTMFLGGSVHILRETDFPLPKQFDLAFEQAEVIVFETDTSQLSDPEVAAFLMSQIYLPDNQTLGSVLDEETFLALMAVCQEYGLSVLDVIRMRPSIITSVLSVLQIQKIGFVEQGVDDYFMERTRQDRYKQIAFLESLEEQIDIMISMGEGYENEYVQYFLREMENTETQLEALIADWRNGVLTDRNNMLMEMKDEWPHLYRSLILDRHMAWMPQLEDFLVSDQIHFVIVGNAHIFGPDGLVQMLRDIGCEVTPLR
ncbi:MAG: TraB/GumN family protein [Treponema sp.]|nr:TraB/GumN family protein [Treponema sp.]MCL2237702.1 TraB/GumN family protein [Treponema sp.]